MSHNFRLIGFFTFGRHEIDIGGLHFDGLPDMGAELEGVRGLNRVVASDRDSFGDRSAEAGRIELNRNLAGLSRLNLLVPREGRGASRATRPHSGDFKHGVTGVGDDVIVTHDLRGFDLAKVEARL